MDDVMLNESALKKLREKISDDRTHDNVSYYGMVYSPPDAGTSHTSLLSSSGDAVSITTSINL